MKKIFALFLIILFAITLAFSISNELTKNSSTSGESTGYASIIPIPPPEPPGRRGC